MLDMEKEYVHDPHVIQFRCQAASSLLRGEYSLGLQNLLDFFDILGQMMARNAVQHKLVYDNFYGRVVRYWTAALPLVENEKITMGNPQLWEDTAYMYRVFNEIRAHRLDRSIDAVIPSSSEIERFLKEEVSLLSTGHLTTDSSQQPHLPGGNPTAIAPLG